MSRPLPSPTLVVLIGAPASGKSTWATENFSSAQIVSSDQLRGVVGEHELDLAATDDVFELIDRIVEMRLGRKLTTVIDTTGLESSRRAAWLQMAKAHGVPTAAVRFATSAAECRRRNRERPHPVAASALDAMLKKARQVDLDSEAWDVVLTPEPVRMVTPKLAAAVPEPNAQEEVDRTKRGMKFGLLVSEFAHGGDNIKIADELVETAVAAEAAGFDSLWVMDHLIQTPRVGRHWDPMLDSYTTLGFLAKATSTIKLGVLVSAVTFRNVGHLAKMIATLDVLSGGRAIAGLGAGNHEHEHLAYGMDFPSDRERLRLLEDVLQSLPLFWGPGSPSFKGEVLTVPEALSYPRPIQDRIPMIVGGSGEKVTLRLAAQYADGCNIFGDAATVRKRVAVLREHCGRLDRDPAEVEVTHLGAALVGHDPNDLADRIERLRPANQGPDKFAASVRAGTVEDHVAGFLELAKVGVDTAIVSPPGFADADTLAPYAELITRLSAQ